MIRRKNVVISLGVLASLSATAWFTRGEWVGPASIVVGIKPVIHKSEIASALEAAKVGQDFPKELTLDLKGRPYPVSVEYAFHEGLTNEMAGHFRTYKPDYGAFVAIDATTGRVLTLISYSEEEGFKDQNLALRATFPSASVFKIVTASAAIAERKLSSSSIVSFNGRPHTLYRKNIFAEKINRWTTHITLKEAFAKSINTVFGKLGVFTVGPSELKNYAERFGFNRKLPSDLPFEQSKADITEDPWEVAESASGYTRNNTMSPLQGALIAAAIANDGKLMEPWAVEDLRNAEGEIVYQNVPTLSNTVIDPQSANEMKELMRETVASGTSRVSFRGFKKSPYGFVDVGGKTGSLLGDEPKGKYDWFVGYGSAGEHRIAVASLVISNEYWKVKSSLLARKALEYYFNEKFSVYPAGGRRLASRENVAMNPVSWKKRIRRHRRR
jgi:cell division protein FtsI/penicillin-binding protein 2